MNQEEYLIEANVEYPVVDDGTYAPIGSNPLFVTLEVIRSGDNADHPYAKGYITNDTQDDDEDIPESKTLINHIIDINGVHSDIHHLGANNGGFMEGDEPIDESNTGDNGE